MLRWSLLQHQVPVSLQLQCRPFHSGSRHLPNHSKTAATTGSTQFWTSGKSTAADPVQLSREGHSAVFLFGVEHYSLQVEPAEFILKHNPAAVVFENSFSASGGNGAIVDCEDSTSLDGSHLVAMACETAARMQSSPPAVFDHVWQQLKQQCETELLGHMAAFIIGTKVVHADRPKVDTYLRLDELVSAADLDLAIEAQVCINHADCLNDSCGYVDLRQAAETHHIFTTERDHMLCQSLQQSSLNGSQCVVGVVGVAHVPGIIQQWNSDKRDCPPDHPHTSAAPRLQAQSGGGAMQGVRRALLERFIELSCSPAVYADMQRQLSPLPAEAVHPYALTQELYGSPRMLLAMLPPEHLHKVCSGWNCDMWDVLKPVRDVRPRYGGPGLDEELLWELRQLYFDLG